MRVNPAIALASQNGPYFKRSQQGATLGHAWAQSGLLGPIPERLKSLQTDGENYTLSRYLEGPMIPHQRSTAGG
jgi:hypothetical protein